MIRLLQYLTCAIAIILPLNQAFSQGATGGSFGNDNKSLSGSRDEPRSSAPARRERSEQRAVPRRVPAPKQREAAPKQREAAPRRGGGSGVAKFNGTWSVTSVGETCSETTRTTVIISDGRMTSANDTGTINANGAFSSVGNYGGIRVVAQGRASATNGSGRFQRSDGCVGRLTSTKQ